MPWPRKYEHRRNLPHYLKDSRPIFVTYATARRWMLPEPARKLVLEEAQQARMIELHAAVVMPEHVHLVFSAMRDSTGSIFPLSEIMHSIKGRSARRINLLLQRRGAVWQDEYFDHVLRSNETLAEKVLYVLLNPVRAGIVREAHEYPWSLQGKVPVL